MMLLFFQDDPDFREDNVDVTATRVHIYKDSELTDKLFTATTDLIGAVDVPKELFTYGSTYYGTTQLKTSLGWTKHSDVLIFSPETLGAESRTVRFPRAIPSPTISTVHPYDSHPRTGFLINVAIENDGEVVEYSYIISKIRNGDREYIPVAGAAHIPSKEYLVTATLRPTTPYKIEVYAHGSNGVISEPSIIYIVTGLDSEENFTKSDGILSVVDRDDATFYLDGISATEPAADDGRLLIATMNANNPPENYKVDDSKEYLYYRSAEMNFTPLNID